MSGSLPADGATIWTISALTGDVRQRLESAYADIHVTGEVSNLARPRSGHLYLKLKDAGSQLSTVIYRGVALRLRFDLEDGMEVIARGRLSVYEPRGEYQFLVEQIEPKGVGPLEMAFRQLKEKLSVQGYFEPGRKKRLPEYPRRVALVTSPTGAAVRDMLEVLHRRWPALEVWVCPVTVQGEGAAEQIATMIQGLQQYEDDLDVIIVGRGGGSLEDLWPFNEEMVAKAIYGSNIPIVSGVGHETDLTISDLVADVRALTPTEAAERVTPNRAEITEWLQNSHSRLRSSLKNQLAFARQRLEDLSDRRCFRMPLAVVRDREQDLDQLSERLQRGIQQQLQQAQQKMEAMADSLESLSPLNVLRRGYTLTQREDGSVLRRPEQARPGDVIVTVLSTGRIISRVEQSEEAERDRSPQSHP